MPAASIRPTGYAVIATVGLGWAVALRARRPQVYATIGLGAHAVTGHIAVIRADEADLDKISLVIVGAFSGLPPAQ